MLERWILGLENGEANGEKRGGKKRERGIGVLIWIMEMDVMKYKEVKFPSPSLGGVGFLYPLEVYYFRSNQLWYLLYFHHTFPPIKPKHTPSSIQYSPLLQPFPQLRL